MTSAWLQAVRAGGPLSCYQGFGVAVLSMAAYKALYFGLYDTAKMLLLPKASRPVHNSWCVSCMAPGDRGLATVEPNNLLKVSALLVTSTSDAFGLFIQLQPRTVDMLLPPKASATLS
jgi:hypothetical protein